MSFIEIIPGFITLQVPVQPVSVEKTEPPESEIVEITTDDILDSSDEGIIPHIKDVDSAAHIIKNAPFVKTASTFEGESLDKTNTRDRNVSKDTSEEEVVQGLNEDFYSLNNLRVHGQLVLNCVNDLDDISTSGNPEYSEKIDFVTCHKTVETILCQKDKPVIPVGPHEYSSLVKDKLVCNHCQYASNSLEHVKLHIETAHREITQMYQCPYCPYNSKWNLQYHVIQKHQDAKDIQWFRYCCDKCEFKTYHRNALKRHKLIHLKPDFHCYHCSHKSKRKDKLKCHISRHFKNKEVPFHCYSCNFVTIKRDVIIKHIKKHSKCDKRYRCNKCHYKTNMHRNLKKHKIIHFKPEEIHYFCCYHCSYKSSRKCTLRRHIFQHFKNKEVLFHCYICDFMTQKRDLIIEHLKKHAQVKLRKLSYKLHTEKYCCDKCNYNTFKRYNFNRHKIIHLKPKEIQYFYCYHCSQKFKHKDGLKYHISMHFNNENVPLHCYICDFMTLKRDLIIEHIKKHAQVKLHKPSYKTQTEKYRCDMCNYNTFRRQHFNRHKLTHLKPEKIQYFYCYHCSHKSKQKYDLKVHILRHFNNKNVPFHCYICDFMTLKRDLIIEHIKKHSKVKLRKRSRETEPEKYNCDKCDYNTFRRVQLNRHKLIHLKPEDAHYFYCYHCCHKATRKDNLKIHIFNHFKNEEVTFHCYICDFVTVKKDLITKHIKEHSKLQIATENMF